MLHLGGQRVDEAERGKSSGPDPDGLGFELDKNQFVNKIQPSSWMSRLGVNTRGRCIRSGRSAHTSLRKISKRADCPPSRGAIRGSVQEGFRERYKQRARGAPGWSEATTFQNCLGRCREIPHGAHGSQVVIASRTFPCAAACSPWQKAFSCPPRSSCAQHRRK